MCVCVYIFITSVWVVFFHSAKMTLTRTDYNIYLFLFLIKIVVTTDFLFCLDPLK